MQNYTHIKIYKTAKNLLKIATELTKTFNREYRYTVGQDLYTSIVEFMIMIYDAYIMPDFKVQHEYILKLRRQLQYINVYTKLSFDIHLISKENEKELTRLIEDIDNQSRGWLLSSQKKVKNEKIE